jgi:hypothetical protein
LNPNDFTRRESFYEGADDGLYRMYRPPRLALPWMAAKAIYRLHQLYGQRGRDWVSAHWYRWLYEGNRDEGLAHLARMGEICRAAGARLRVVLMPVRSGFEEKRFRLSDLYAEIARFGETKGIEVFDLTPAFAPHVETAFDFTDHFFYAGNFLMARTLSEILKPRAVASSAAATRHP